ncbi:MAG: NAD(P)H-dependent oxidoreductase [Alphaproteobacteria bacterium]|nr:NAD(P)H-dependent oxidoreductase [Alphaproteobacteria bacterium]
MILYVNACVRPQSRTKQLADYILQKSCQNIKEIVLENENIVPLNGETLERRRKLTASGIFDDQMFNLAKDFAVAEKIVIAAPYWDLSFPALLKCYIEQINVIGLTFAYNDVGKPYGLCRADVLIYVTTAGGKIFNEDAGFGYIKSLAHHFYGIKNVLCIKAENLDIVGADVDDILQKTDKEIDKILEQYSW